MPQFKNSPFAPPVLAVRGLQTYLFGSLNMGAGNTNMAISQVALATNVATLTVQILNGPMPSVGDLISVVNTTNSSGLFNVGRVALTAVNISPATGAGTVSFNLTGSTVTAVADFGSAISEPAEVPETLTNGTFSRAAVTQTEDSEGQFNVDTSVTFPTMPTAATVSLQMSITPASGDWTTLGVAAVVANSAFTTGPVGQFALSRPSAVRFAVTGVSGTGTIVAKVF